MIDLFLPAAGIAIIVATAATTAGAYTALPARLALQFAFDGSPLSLWPRPAIWLVVAIQVAISGTFARLAWTSIAGQFRPQTSASLIICDCVLLIAWRAQVLVIEAAKDPENRARMDARYYAFVGVMLAIALLAGFFSPRA